MEILTDSEVNRVAWREIINGARSFIEDWIDEEGEFTEADGDRIFDRALDIVKEMEKHEEWIG